MENQNMAVYNSPPSTIEGERSSRVRGGFLGIMFGVLAVLYAVGFAIGGELSSFVVAGLQTIPFALLAVLAYLGVDQMWARIVSLIYLLGLVAAVALVGFMVSFAVLADLQVSGAAATPGDLGLEGSDGWRLLAIFVGSVVAIAIGALGFIPGVRRALSRVLPINPESFVHTLAVVSVISLTLISFVPLVVLGAPPILDLVNVASESGTDLTGGQDDAAQLRTTVYGLVWTVPGTIVAVGYAVRRNLRDALGRLGLVRPTIRQVVIGIVAAFALVALVQVVGRGIEWVWQAMGWPATDGEAFSELLAFAFSPIGAVVIGVTAGLGEELAVRGVLQPRLGILLSNLFFTGLHAFQYNWDSLLIVFTIGMVLGYIRKRTNTTTSAITHGVYDFLLIMASVLAIPGFTE
jgi:uncharacterized protein